MKIQIKVEGDDDIRVVIDFSWNEAQAVKKLIRIGIANNQGNFVKTEEIDAAQKIVTTLEKITKAR